MSARLAALTLAGLLLVAGLPTSALAQSLEEQVGDAAAKGERLAGDAADDPQATAANATNASWQGRQVNWTEAWTCETAHAVDEDAGEAAQRALDCPDPASARAGEDEQVDEDVNRSQARAEEAEADAERAARDGVAVVQAFIEDTREDPEQAPDHATTLANRTLAIVERLVGGLVGVAELPLSGLALAGDGLAWSAQQGLAGMQATAAGTGWTLAQAGHGLQAGAGALQGGAATSVDAIASVSEAGLEGVRASWASLTGLVDAEADRSSEPGEDLAEPDERVVEPELVDEVELPR